MLYGTSVFVTNQTLRAFKSPEVADSAISGQLVKSIAKRLVEDYKGSMLVVPTPATQETEFQFSVHVFNDEQLNAYYNERKKQEAEEARLVYERL